MTALAIQTRLHGSFAFFVTGPMLKSKHQETLVLSVTEAAALFGISRAFAYRLIQSGQWSVIKIGRCTRISRQFLNDWASQLEGGQSA